MSEHARYDLNEKTVEGLREMGFAALARAIFDWGETDADTGAPFVLLNGGNANASLMHGPEFDGSIIFVGTAAAMRTCKTIDEVVDAVFDQIDGFEE